MPFLSPEMRIVSSSTRRGEYAFSPLAIALDAGRFVGVPDPSSTARVSTGLLKVYFRASACFNTEIARRTDHIVSCESGISRRPGIAGDRDLSSC